MKKVLFATTALVASAGIASADVAVTGSAEMGIFGGTGVEVQFFQDIDVTFTMSGETDNGLTFGAAVDLDEGNDDSCTTTTTIDDMGTTGDTSDDVATSTTSCVDLATADNTAHGGVAIYIKGDFGSLTMGDTDGGFDWAMSEVALAGGSIADDETTHAGYNGNAGLDGNYDGQIVRYDHSVGDFSFAVSVEADESGAGDPIFGVGVKYNADLGGSSLGVGLGYQSGGPGASDEAVGLSIGATMDNGLSVGLNYSDVTEGTVEYTHIGIGLGYTMDALAVGINYGQYDHTPASTGTDADGFGFAATYDLGGGASVKFGYGSGGSPSTDTFSLGVAMSF